MTRHLLRGSAMLAAALLASACGQEDAGTFTVARIRVLSGDAAVAAGRSMRFSAAGFLADGTPCPLVGGVSWSTSDATLATIDGTGLARGLRPGTVTISALEPKSGVRGSAQIVVTAPLLEALSIAAPATTIPVGLSSAFTAEGRFSDGTVGPVSGGLTWSSSSAGVATVDADGLVRALSPGGATIRVSHAASRLFGTASLTVTSAVVQRLDVSPATASLAPGLALRLSASIHLTDGTDTSAGTELRWSSSSEAVATVDAAGLVQAVSPGLADVTLTHVPSGMTATVAVTVTDATLTELTLSPSTPTVPLGDTVAFSATGRGSDGSSGLVVTGLTWSVADLVVAAVDATGRAASLSEGSTTVTVTHEQSGASATATLVVGPAALRSLAMLPAAITLAVGDSQAAIESPFEISGTYSDGTVRFLGPYTMVVPIGAIAFSWSTSNASIARVMSGGRVEARAPGVATISALDPTSGLAASSVVTVVSDLQVALEVSPPTLTLQVGASDPLMAIGRSLSGGVRIYMPGSTTWSTSAPEVATVNGQGTVVAIAPGTATITCTDPLTGLAGTAVITVQ